MNNMVDEIKARLDIVEYIGRSGVALKKSGSHHKACCPFHSEKTPSFMVSADKQTWRCYGSCNEGGDVLSFAMKRHGWTFVEALEELAREVGIKRERAARPDAQAERSQELLRLAQKRFQAAFAGSPAAEYWSGRGFGIDLAQAWGIGYAGAEWDTLVAHFRAVGYNDDALIAAGLARRSDKGRVYDAFRNRLMIPIRDDKGRLAGFAGRALSDDDQPKYLNSPQSELFDKGRLLFGLDRARQAIAYDNRLILVEGYMDVIALHSIGHANAVGQMGTALTEQQRKLIGQRDVILALDGDGAGQASTLKAIEALRGQSRLSVVRLPGGKDPADAVADGSWGGALQGRQTAIEWLIEREPVPPETLSEGERVRLAEALLTRLNGLGSRIEMMWAKGAVARHMNVSELWLRQTQTEGHTRLSVVTPPSARSVAPLEAYLLNAMVHHPQLVSVVQRALSEAQESPLATSDFAHYGPVFALLLEAVAQVDEEPRDYLLARVPADALQWDEYKPSSEDDLVINLLRLRMDSIQRAIEGVQAQGDAHQLRDLVRQRERLRQVIAHKAKSAARRFSPVAQDHSLHTPKF